ncbi:hypothetical protein FOQG_14434 [Fusarium oxysporum f. sp. raphani 54005]|uniref:Uncharacterized protein n=8 Tax=Fusarium TaxID=5506 RepID=W9IX17_FUSOX|nr:hypothetical protein FOXG_19908 [Fusarium oxysporum f. sp. lycopersici 4287]EWY97234.1 hypothetical protein FOYG_05710 [Fusarium oxysporum NRRL 32931]EXA48810.1 hypothetical protein FOVG_05476 [Fusarium oxysporum f. sp. pisi HDV247]EXK27783.1 hypothetical protein FOMG_15632 [Fusarium oxysporum f. sp. melonis 26406]EXK81101.1 hypothetical protein FOQG_14434 [Fusarium oxysporum f. sp. raphani 54005]EXL76047.1 hypothetical protein FOPG_09054 [Fusarium oxysporum f. sp. conglutinans race 2 54008
MKSMFTRNLGSHGKQASHRSQSDEAAEALVAVAGDQGFGQ